MREVDIAACVIYVWDYCITMGMEIEHVWPGKWTALKVLYLIQRYLPFIDTVWPVLHRAKHQSEPRDVPFAHECGAVVFVVGMAASELVLTFRAWAVWNRNRVLTVVLPIIFMGIWVPHVYFLIQSLRSLSFANPPIPQFVGCFAMGNLTANNGILLSWVLLLVWDTIIMILMIIPAIKAYRFRGHSALYATVYGEGIVYYVYLFILSSVNIILLRLQSIDVGYRFIIVTYVIDPTIDATVY
ncbi:unnamed protein product [Cyclocybe aegerita]|uniref:DUF6533 domain-containing protein n=1 Tax=Cyclocybe aegerita TaxID=1973307 RepID=A0A8S0VUD5_CYCAE|nr:unnamed protein product [Cyclocybe aegerita]